MRPSAHAAGPFDGFHLVAPTVAHPRGHLEVLDDVDGVLPHAVPVGVRQRALDQDPAAQRTLEDGALSEENLQVTFISLIREINYERS